VFSLSKKLKLNLNSRFISSNFCTQISKTAQRNRSAKVKVTHCSSLFLAILSVPLFSQTTLCRFSRSSTQVDIAPGLAASRSGSYCRNIFELSSLVKAGSEITSAAYSSGLLSVFVTRVASQPHNGILSLKKGPTSMTIKCRYFYASIPDKRRSH